MNRDALLGRSRLREIHVLLLLAGVIGVGGALATVAFRLAVRGVELLLTGHGPGLVAAAAALPWWQRLLVPAVGGLAAGVTLQAGLHLVRGRPSTDYMEAVAVGDGVLGVRTSLVKSLSSLFTIGSGGSIGREGSMVQLAALLGSTTGRLMPRSQSRQRLLVACGAAAGLAAAYDAPIAGALFVAEIVLGSIAMEHLGPMLVSSVVSAATVHQILGFEPVFAIPPLHFVSRWETLLHLVMGIVCGAFAPVFVRVLRATEKAFVALTVPVCAKLALGGAIVGALSVARPEVWGNGYSVVGAILGARLTWQVLGVVLVLKVAATAVTAGSGATGGVFTPTLFVGAALGFLLGTGAHALFPAITAGPNTYAVVGMGAFLAATTLAPVTSILMIFEMTLDYQIMLPLMAGCVTAYYVARFHLRGESIYAHALRSKAAEAVAGRLSGLEVRDFLDATAPTVAVAAGLDEALRLLRESRETALLVVDDDGRLAGILPVESVATALAENGRPAGWRIADVATREFSSLTPEQSLGAAYELFARTRLPWLPVIAAEGDPRLLGRVTKSEVFRAVADTWRPDAGAGFGASPPRRP